MNFNDTFTSYSYWYWVGDHRSLIAGLRQWPHKFKINLQFDRLKHLWCLSLLCWVIGSFNLSTIKSQNSICLKPKYEGGLLGVGVARHIIGSSILDIKQGRTVFSWKLCLHTSSQQYQSNRDRKSGNTCDALSLWESQTWYFSPLSPS